MSRPRGPSALRRVAVLAALVLALVVAGATPAFAHATLLTTEPQPGGKFETSPGAISLRFNEPVEVSLGGIRLFDGSSDRIDIGAPEHPDGESNQVRASMPKLDDGTYVVTWRVMSADAHPVRGRVHVPGRCAGFGEERQRPGRTAPRTTGRKHGGGRRVRDRPRRDLRRPRAAHRRRRLHELRVPTGTAHPPRPGHRLGRLGRHGCRHRRGHRARRRVRRRRYRCRRSSTPRSSATCSTRVTAACRSSG